MRAQLRRARAHDGRARLTSLSKLNADEKLNALNSNSKKKIILKIQIITRLQAEAPQSLALP